MFTESLEGQLQHLDQALTNSDHLLSYFLIHLFPPFLMGKQQQPILIIRKIRLERKDHFIRGAALTGLEAENNFPLNLK
jgi:hypothetical protein